MEHTETNVECHIRWMVRKDVPAIMTIEEGAFEFPWTEEEMLNCLRQRNCIGMVFVRNERILGFMVYELFKATMHVLNFAVASGFRRRGIGRQMVQKLIGKLSQQRRDSITLEVRETNIDAQLFWRSMGFKAGAVIRGHYEDSEDDAYVMEFTLPQCEKTVR